MNSDEFWLRLLMIKGIGAGKLNKLTHIFNAQTNSHEQALDCLNLSQEQKHAFSFPNARYLDKALMWLEDKNNRMLLPGENDYPSALYQLGEAPPILFIRGNSQSLQKPQVAMVGSRNYSQYGEQWGRYFAQELAICGLAITSGLASGIDGICHRGALDVQGTTIAVLGSGLANVYPKKHQRLSEEIVDNGGVLVSEYLPTESPLAVHFPKRNRIISGLSLGVLVIEASLRSGSLITARCALEQGREVFALPGNLGCSGSEGVHWLIQQGAYLVAQPTDILEQLNTSLNWVPLLPPESINETIPTLENEQELPFSDVLANVGDEVTPVDIVADKVGQSVSDVVVKLLDLELAGWIKAVPGGYIRIRKVGYVRYG